MKQFDQNSAVVVAKVQVMGAVAHLDVEGTPTNTGENLSIAGVHGGETNAEDNTFAEATPHLNLQMTVTNPNAVGKLAAGKQYYVFFVPAD